MTDLVYLHKLLATYPIITLFGPFFLLIAIILAVYFIRVSRRLRIHIAIQEQTDVMLRKLSSAVENSPASIIITDKNGIIEYVNPAFIWMTGYLPDDVLGKNPRMLKGGEQTVDFYRNLWETLMQGKVWRGEFHNKRKDGTLFWESASISPISDLNGKISNFVAVKENITDKKLMLKQLEQLASFDVLTGLYNRRMFLERLAQSVELAGRNHQRFALIFIDLDGFKQINDNYGHEAGDIVLKTVSSRLLESVRMSDTAGRMGGDEFTVSLGTINHPEDAGQVADKILESLRRPIILTDGTNAKIDASIGISIFPVDADNGDALIAAADNAMYEVKRNGKSGWSFFSHCTVEQNGV